MAKGDYICCGACDCKLIYDGSRSARDSLEERWGDPDGPIYTVKILCPDCLKKERAAKDEILNRMPTIGAIIERIQSCETMREIERTIEQGEHLTGEECVRLAEAAGKQIDVVKTRPERKAAALRSAIDAARRHLPPDATEARDILCAALEG